MIKYGICPRPKQEYRLQNKSTITALISQGESFIPVQNHWVKFKLCSYAYAGSYAPDSL